MRRAYVSIPNQKEKVAFNNTKSLKTYCPYLLLTIFSQATIKIENKNNITCTIFQSVGSKKGSSSKKKKITNKTLSNIITQSVMILVKAI